MERTKEGELAGESQESMAGSLSSGEMYMCSFNEGVFTST